MNIQNFPIAVCVLNQIQNFHHNFEISYFEILLFFLSDPVLGWWQFFVKILIRTFQQSIQTQNTRASAKRAPKWSLSEFDRFNSSNHQMELTRCRNKISRNFTHCLVVGSFSLIFFKTLISSLAASLYFSTFLMIFRARISSLENVKTTFSLR